MVQFLEGRNRAWAQLNAPINGSDTNVALVAWQGSRLSDVTTASGRKVRAQIYERDAETGAITKCELVDITNNVSDVLIIERAVESTRATDTTNTYAATPQSFTASAIIEEVISSEVMSEIQDEVNRLETDKLDKATYDAERLVYGASSAGDDDYEILTGDSLATVADGRIFAVRADVPNNGASTLKVDATSPVALKKLSWGAFADLATWDIIANQIFFAMKNTAASCYQFSLDPATLSLTVPDADETTKGIVERSTDLEVETWTDTERFTTPKQMRDRMLRMVNNDLSNTTWKTRSIPMLRYNVSGTYYYAGWGESNTNFISGTSVDGAGWVAEIATNLWGWLRSYLPWLRGWSNQIFRFSDAKKWRLSWSMKVWSGTQRTWFWLSTGNTDIYDPHTATTASQMRLLIDNTTFRVVCSDGTNYSAQTTTNSFTKTNWNDYTLDFDGTNLKLYINWVLEATINTNLPTGTWAVYLIMGQSANSTTSISDIVFSREV